MRRFSSSPRISRRTLLKAILVIPLVIAAYKLLRVLLPQISKPIARRTFAGEKIKLPDPARGNLSVEDAISRRRSRRDYSSDPLSLRELSAILWSAQGITDPRRGFRTAPSAGALYPLEIYLSVREEGIEELERGLYLYEPEDHSLVKISSDDSSSELEIAALGQEWVGEAPVRLIIVGYYEITARKYGERAERYVHIEAGAVAENVYLQAESLGLSTVFVGAFLDPLVRRILGLGDEATPLGIMPIGRRAQ